MKFVLGDVKWLVDGKIKVDPKTEITVLVTDGRETLSLEVIKINFDNLSKKFVITCEVPPEVKAVKAGKKP